MKSKLICIVIIVSSFISGYFTCFSIKQNQVDKKVNDISLEGTFQDERFDKISLYNNLLYYYYVVDGEKMSRQNCLYFPWWFNTFWYADTSRKIYFTDE